jgi:hypothetical protein
LRSGSHADVSAGWADVPPPESETADSVISGTSLGGAATALTGGYGRAGGCAALYFIDGTDNALQDRVLLVL